VFQSNGANTTNLNISNSIFKKGSTRAYYSPDLITNSVLTLHTSKDDTKTLIKNSSVIPIGNSWSNTLFKSGSASTTLQVNVGTSSITVPLIITLRISSVTTSGDRAGFAETTYYYRHAGSETLTSVATPSNIVTPSGITITPATSGTTITFTIQNTVSGSGTTYGFNISTSVNSINVPIVS
jgi:hypothetical protein